MNLYRATCEFAKRTVYVRAPDLLEATLLVTHHFKGQLGQRAQDEGRFAPDSVELVARAEDILDWKGSEAA